MTDGLLRKNGLEWVALGVFALFWTAVAWHVWPCWDDAWLWLAGTQLTPRQIELSHGDRPLHGWMEARMLAAGVTRPLSAAMHALVWFSTGAVTRKLWRRLFPDSPHLGLAAGIVAMSPIFVTTQIVLVNPTWSGSLPALLFWAPFVASWPVGKANATNSAMRVVGWALFVAAVVLGCLISEYAVSAGLAGAAFVLALGVRRASGRIEAPWKTGLALALVCLVGYAAFRALARGGMRPETAPGYLLHHLVQRAVSFPFFLATSIFRGVFGAVLSRIGGVRIEQEGMERVTSLALGVGIAALLVTERGLRGVSDVASSADESVSSPFERFRAEIALVFGTAVGLVPFCLTARIPADDATSRYFLPVVPMVAVLAVSIVRRVTSGRARGLLVAVLVGTAVYWSVRDAGAAFKDRHRVRAWARQLAPYAAKGPALVVFSSAAAWPPYTRDYELTARLRLDMRREVPGVHVWATRQYPDGGEMTLLPSSSAPASPARLAIDWDRLTRMEESLSEVLWARVEANDKLRIHVTDPAMK